MLPYDPASTGSDGDKTAQAGPGPSTTANANANKRSSVVITTIINDDGSESARVGACSNCRSRKIKCSGDRPICKTCEKNKQVCEYPLHISRKRKGKEGSTSAVTKRPANGSSPNVEKSQSSLNDLTASQPNHIYPPPMMHEQQTYSDYNFPTLDFTADTLPLPPHNGLNGVNGAPVDNAWLESFLSYDFGNDVPLPLQSFGHHALYGEAGSQVKVEGTGPTPARSDEGLTRVSSVRSQRTSQAKFKVPYFSGPTAIAPGYRQVIADVSAPPSPIHRHFALPSLSTPVMDSADEYPSIEAISHLLPLFQLHFSYFFPLLPPSVETYASSPPHLVNIVCALAARYSPIYAGPRHGGSAVDESSASHTWASKAKEQVSQRLAISDEDMIQTLLMISWYEFGQDRDSGLWMYSGMALRMGQDLGLDTVCDDSVRSPLPDRSPRHRIAGSLLMQDAIMTIGTGRSGMYPTPSSSTGIPHFPPLAGSGMPDPFHYLIKIFAIAYQVTQVLVRPDVVNAGDLLEKAQSDLNEFNTSLPSDLRFETSTFRNYAAIAQGGAFVLIHLWFHTLIILAYQPTIIYSDLPTLESDSHAQASKEISASSAKTILDIVVFAELIDPKAITQPWVNYPLYTAGRTFLSQTLPTGTPIENTSDPVRTGRLHMAKIARANFQKVVDVLGVLQSYWGGVRYIRSVLVQKGEGVAQLSLVGEGEDLTVPDRVSEWIANASSKQNSDIMGLSFSGTMHSPTDSRFSVVYPSKGAQHL